TSGTHNREAGLSRSKRPRQHETVEELLLPKVHHEFLLWEGCNRDAKSRYNSRLAQLLPRHIYSPCIVNWDVLNQMGCDGEIDDMLGIRVRKVESEEEFDKVCADDELQSKKIIKFRLDGRAHRGLRNDDNFNAHDYWLSISQEDNLSFSRSHTSTIRNPILRMIHKMITYGLCQRITGYDKVQKNDLWLLNLQPGVPRVGIPRSPRAYMQDLYDRMGHMEIRPDAIEQMEYRQSYH
ncbi:hypothetical protein Tco_1422375, partial [Tanacetum coccineum]